jgi:hypothetical protein
MAVKRRPSKRTPPKPPPNDLTHVNGTGIQRPEVDGKTQDLAKVNGMGIQRAKVEGKPPGKARRTVTKRTSQK